MTTDETQISINSALNEIDAIRNYIKKIGKSKEYMFQKFEKACGLLGCAGEINQANSSDDFRFYDSTNSVNAKYFVGENEKSSFNDLFNCTNFFLKHHGSSEQFATALSMIFANSNHIRCYPVRIKLKMTDGGEQYDEYSFINFTQFFDDDGSLIHSCFVDLFHNTINIDSLQEMLNILSSKVSNEKEKCLSAMFDGINYYTKDIDLSRNFTIFETLTDLGGVDFNIFGYEMDYSNANIDKCGDLTNYISKKELKEHLSTYIHTNIYSK